MIPVGLSDESLEIISVLFVTVRHGFRVFAGEVGEETFEKKLCILPCFGASEVLEVGCSELLQSPERASAGMVASCSIARFRNSTRRSITLKE